MSSDDREAQVLELDIHLKLLAHTTTFALHHFRCNRYTIFGVLRHFGVQRDLKWISTTLEDPTNRLLDDGRHSDADPAREIWFALGPKVKVEAAVIVKYLDGRPIYMKIRSKQQGWNKDCNISSGVKTEDRRLVNITVSPEVVECLIEGQSKPTA
ncbi:hypothetical protein MMC07_003753 [Pseudocyphellaria aurata]|nr:hypothetical protein [Pseudocyphellaria aurata]